MLDHMDGIMRAVAKQKTPWKEDLYSTVKLAWQKLSNYYAEVTPTTSKLLISPRILDVVRKLRWFRKWDKAVDIHTEDVTLYTTQYQQAYLNFVENEYCAKHGCVLVIKPESVLNNNLFFSAMSSGSVESSIDPYDSSRDDEEYLMPNNVAETTPRESDRTSRLLATAGDHLNSPPQSRKNYGQLVPNLNG